MLSRADLACCWSLPQLRNRGWLIGLASRGIWCRKESVESETQNPADGTGVPGTADNRRHPRFKLDVDIKIRARGSELLRGHAIDISESGISAILKIEVPVGTVVELDFSLPLAEVSVLAVVRQRNAFRYGFQFADPDANRDLIRRACDQFTPCS